MMNLADRATAAAESEDKMPPPEHTLGPNHARQAEMIRATAAAMASRMPDGVSHEQMATQIITKLLRDADDPKRTITNLSDDDFMSWLFAQLKMRGIAPPKPEVLMADIERAEGELKAKFSAMLYADM